MYDTIRKRLCNTKYLNIHMLWLLVWMIHSEIILACNTNPKGVLGLGVRVQSEAFVQVRVVGSFGLRFFCCILGEGFLKLFHMRGS